LIILEWLIGVEELLLLSSFSGFLLLAQSVCLGHPCGYNEGVFIDFGASNLNQFVFICPKALKEQL
jgi:hypothetical protein